MARASAAEAAVAPDRRARLRRHAAKLWAANANPDGPGLVLREQPFEVVNHADVEPLALAGVLRLARLAGASADALRSCPECRVRRAAAVLAARAYPLLAGLDG